MYSMLLFFNDTSTTEIYTLSLHDALPISQKRFQPAAAWYFPFYLCFGFCPRRAQKPKHKKKIKVPLRTITCGAPRTRSEEHTSELQSQFHLVCRLLLEKQK